MITFSTRAALAAAALALAACGDRAASGSSESAARDSILVQPPVPLDPSPAIAYPEQLADTAAVLTVRLRLFADEQGHVVPESTRIAEPSGVAAVDSAAVTGAARLRYAPALREGRPVATSFVQPVEFRRP